MKKHIKQKQLSNPSVQTKAKNQAPKKSILQAYKSGTTQLAIEEEEPVQGKFEEAQLKENKTGLPDNLKSGVENLSGHSLDDVKVHYNSDKPASLQAHAYAQGTNIHVAPGQEKHLPHEAWHVVQQKEGRVQPTRQLKGNTNINDDAGLETEADVMGAKAVQLKEIVQMHQHEERMKERRAQKRNLKKAIREIYAAGNNAGNANGAQIGIHDRVLHAGQHHAERNITVAALIGDITAKIQELTDLNLADSDNP